MAAQLTDVWYASLPELSFGYPTMSRREFHMTVQEIHRQARVEGTLRQAMRRNAENSLFYFVVYVLHWTFLDCDFAYALCARCQGDGKWGTMWLLAREHYKSTVITIAETLRTILLHPNSTTLIYSYKFDSAKDLFYTPIKNELESNQIIRLLWPDVVYTEGEKPEVWTATSLNVKRSIRRKESTLACASIFSQPTGYHADFLVYDDCVIEENCQTADRMEQTQKMWEMSLNTGNTKALRYCVIGTYYAYGDLYCHIKDESLCKVITQPCYAPDGRGVLYSRESLHEKRRIMGSAVFATQMLLDPKQGSAVSFKEEDIMWWHATTYEGLNVYTFVDPAGEVSRKRDNTVILTVGLDDADNYYLIDIVRDKLTLTQKTQELFRIRRKYKPLIVFYEKNGAAIDVPHILEEMNSKNFRFPIQSLVQSKAKGERIEAMLPLFEQHRVWFPQGGCWHTNWEGRSEDMLHSFIVEELLAYPHTTHDDALDDMANILHPTCVSLMQRPDETSMEERLYNTLRARGVELEPMDGPGGVDDYDPLADYRSPERTGQWSDIYGPQSRQRDEVRSYDLGY